MLRRAYFCIEATIARVGRDVNDLPLGTLPGSDAILSGGLDLAQACNARRRPGRGCRNGNRSLLRIDNLLVWLQLRLWLWLRLLTLDRGVIETQKVAGRRGRRSDVRVDLSHGMDRRRCGPDVVTGMPPGAVHRDHHC